MRNLHTTDSRIVSTIGKQTRVLYNSENSLTRDYVKKPKWLMSSQHDFSQVWSKLPADNNIHLVDNLLLPLVLLSQLYQLIPQGHIFPEKSK